jgi:MSHA biogenesis protein MshK
MVERLSATVFVLALAGAAGASQAQPLADPTRPPAVVAPRAGAEGAGGPRLQSVLISGTRKLAVIDGVTVPLGGRFDGAIVVAIAETEVKLRYGEAVQTLKLYPGIELAPIENQKESRP